MTHREPRISLPNRFSAAVSFGVLFKAVQKLPLAQVHAALAYYHANREQMEADMAAEEADYDQLRREHHAVRAQP